MTLIRGPVPGLWRGPANNALDDVGWTKHRDLLVLVDEAAAEAGEKRAP